MRRVFQVAAIVLGCACAANAQLGRTTDWWTYGGDAQRTGWEKNEQRFTKEEVKSFQLLWKRKLDNRQTGLHTLLAPVILGNLIGYRGFKELAFVAGSSDNLWVIDADLDRMYWQKHFDTASPEQLKNSQSSCAGKLTAMPALPAPVVFRRSGTPRTGASRMRDIFAPKPVYVLSSDGKLHRLNQQDGAEVGTPVDFVPPGSKASSLNIAESIVYTTTSQGCGDASGAVWAIDLNDSTPKANSFVLKGAQIKGLGGPALGNDGVVYVQTGDGQLDPASNEYANSLLALTPKDLKLKTYFSVPEAGSTKKDLDMNVATPVIFSYKGRDLIVTAGKGGRLYLLDPKPAAGGDHMTALYRTPPISVGDGNSVEHGIWGSLSSWEDMDGTRYVLAAVWGPAPSGLAVPVTHGETPNGFIIAFKLQEQEGKPILAPAWISRDMSSPAPPVVAQGVVFGLSNGQFSRKFKQATHATLYGFDGVTGEEMYSTGNQVTAPGNLTGLSLANSRLYFATTDNTINVFGKYLEH
jgi:outer membrane protein assembly factor BamB